MSAAPKSIVLYWHPMSSATPIAAALAELDVPHQRIKVDIKAGEQRRPEYLALNPNGKVPTLTVDGAPMFEALAIQLGLGDQYGVERGLWPAAGTPERLASRSQSAQSTALRAALGGMRVCSSARVTPPLTRSASAAISAMVCSTLSP